MQTKPILLYDDYCPLCTWYSALFVKYGFMEKTNRVAFSKANKEILSKIDIVRGNDEIPLFNPASGKTIYGIDALLEILSWKCRPVKSIGHFPPLYWLLKKFYKFISFNRKVIVAKKCGDGVYDCSPAFSFRYRLLFLTVFLLFNTVMLFPLHNYLFSKLSFYHLSVWQLQAAHLGFVGVNLTLSCFLTQKHRLEYLGQVNMLALLAILLVMPMMLVTLAVNLPAWVPLMYFLLITVFIIAEYLRRMKYVNLFQKFSPIAVCNFICLFIFLAYFFSITKWI
jgi:hypothetical protein